MLPRFVGSRGVEDDVGDLGILVDLLRVSRSMKVDGTFCAWPGAGSISVTRPFAVLAAHIPRELHPFPGDQASRAHTGQLVIHGIFSRSAIQLILHTASTLVGARQAATLQLLGRQAGSITSLM